MANTRPTPVSVFGAVRLCILLLFAPKKLIEAQKQDDKATNNYTTQVEPEHSAYIVRRAFLYSLLLVAFSAAFGYAVGLAFSIWFFCATARFVSWLQIFGACFLLWGTLFVRGWEIETYCGVTFTERVNQWLYRFLYCLGTAILVCSLAWPQCGM